MMFHGRKKTPESQTELSITISRLAMFTVTNDTHTSVGVCVCFSCARYHINRKWVATNNRNRKYWQYTVLTVNMVFHFESRRQKKNKRGSKYCRCCCQIFIILTTIKVSTENVLKSRSDVVCARGVRWIETFEAIITDKWCILQCCFWNYAPFFGLFGSLSSKVMLIAWKFPLFEMVARYECSSYK